MKTLLFIFVFILTQCKTTEETPVTSIADLWGEAGALAFPKSAEKMLSQSKGYISLSNDEKEVLREAFGDRVDKVRIHWNVEPLNEIVSNEFSIPVVGARASAQTYGYDIFMKGEAGVRNDKDHLDLLIHELTHVEQFESVSMSLASFGYHYFKGYYNGGQVYENNIVEKQAMDKTQNWLDHLFTKWQSLKKTTN